MPSTPEANGRTATNRPLLAGLLARTHARVAFCEFVGARPTDVKVSAFAFGRARGVIEDCARHARPANSVPDPAPIVPDARVNLILVLHREETLGRAVPERPLLCTLRPYRDRQGTCALGRYGAFPEPSANGRCLRSADGRSRRIADIAGSDRERRMWEGKRL